MASELIGRLGESGRLPTPPAVVLKILELARRSDVDVDELAETIALDAGLSAKILRFINSPMSGVAREVTSLRQAVALMGMRGVKMMALSFSVISSKSRQPCRGFDRDHYTIHSLACGTAAKALAQATGASNPQDAFSAGLLSQLGRMVLAVSMPGEYAAVLAKAEHIPADLPPLEHAQWGEHYASVGGALLRSWGLPECLCGAVECFRDINGQAGAPVLARLLAVAERAADLICPDEKRRHVNPEAYLDAARTYLGLTDEAVLPLLKQIAGEVDEVRAILQVSKASLRTPDEIEGEVRERIAELSLAMHLENQSMAQHQEDLLRRASTDALTGVGNRAAFDARLSLELERGLRDGSALTLLMLDVDRFKKFNDTFGHQIGDRVLQNVARTLAEHVRKIDYVARYGGEEFTVIAPNTSLGQGAELAERLRKAIAATPVNYGQEELSVTVSVGVASLSSISEPIKEAPLILQKADRLLYQAKCNGRNRVESERPVVAGIAG